jgi:hypothetical protein
LPCFPSGIDTDPVTFFDAVETIADADEPAGLLPPGRRLCHDGRKYRPNFV